MCCGTLCPSAMGRQINYLALPDEFPELVAAVDRVEPALWIPRLQNSKTIELWNPQTPAKGDGWLIRRTDLERMLSQQLWWWEPRHCFVASAGGFGLEMGACYFDGVVLRRERIYFNTLPPVDPDVSRWSGRVISAARRFFVRVPGFAVYCGPRTAAWITDAGASPSMAGTDD